MGTASLHPNIGAKKSNKKISDKVSEALRSNTFQTVTDKTVSFAADIAGVGAIYDIVKSGISAYKTYKQTGSVEQSLVAGAKTYIGAAIGDGIAQAAFSTLGIDSGNFVSQVGKWVLKQTIEERFGK